MNNRTPVVTPDFLNMQMLESYIEKTKNKKADNSNFPPNIPLYYSINTSTENYGYELFKNTYTQTLNNAISFYKKVHTEYIMYHSNNYGIWIFVLKNNELISAYPKMCPINEIQAC